MRAGGGRREGEGTELVDGGSDGDVEREEPEAEGELVLHLRPRVRAEEVYEAVQAQGGVSFQPYMMGCGRGKGEGWRREADPSTILGASAASFSSAAHAAARTCSVARIPSRDWTPMSWPSESLAFPGIPPGVGLVGGAWEGKAGTHG